MEWTLPAGIEGAQLGTAKKKIAPWKIVFSALLLWNSDKSGFAKKTIVQVL